MNAYNILTNAIELGNNYSNDYILLSYYSEKLYKIDNLPINNFSLNFIIDVVTESMNYNGGIKCYRIYKGNKLIVRSALI